MTLGATGSPPVPGWDKLGVGWWAPLEPEPDRDLWTVERAVAELGADGRWEIDAGSLVLHEPVVPYHGEATTRVTARLQAYVEAGGSGRVIAGDAGFWLARSPDVLLAPDVAFVSEARLRAVADPERFPEVPPDLAVEVVSPGDRPAVVRHKVAQYLRFGVRSVWVLDPRQRWLEQHRPGEAVRVSRTAADVVEDPVLPGFRARLADLLPLPWSGSCRGERSHPQ